MQKGGQRRFLLKEFNFSVEMPVENSAEMSAGTDILSSFSP
jgi:hypothetical protein